MPSKSIKDITLQLSIEDTNAVLEALGQMPYIKVYMLISKIQEQASQQVSDSQNPDKQSPDQAPDKE